MFSNSGVLHCDNKKLSNECWLHILNIECIDKSLEQHIDSVIVSICEGSTNTDLATIKRRLINFFSTKNDNTKMGAVAEFFAHIYLKESGFKQEFLYLNLEEGSIKKGFDGYYSFKKDEWLYESKSGAITTNGITHKSKIKESYKDLADKVTAVVKNNPWQNAYNHASHVDVECSSNIRQNIKQLSEDYTAQKFKETIDFNVIPGSTIFLEESWSELKIAEIEEEFQALVSTFDFKKMNIICVNHKSVTLFLDYLSK